MKPALVEKCNPLLSEDLRSRSLDIIQQCSHQSREALGAIIDAFSKQDKYDLMMMILDKDCEERSDLEVNILVNIVSDIRFFRDIKASMEEGDATCFQLCKYMQGFFLPTENVMRYLFCSHQFTAMLTVLDFYFDKILFKQGDKGDTFWIIIKGEVRIFKRMFEASENATSPEDGEFIEKEIVRLGSGNCFGEFALNPNKNNRRLASVETTIDTFFGFIKGSKIVDIIYQANNPNSAANGADNNGGGGSFMEHFQRMPIFKGRPYEVVKQFYDVSEEISVIKNNVIYRIDDTPTHVYFIKKGEFSVQVDRDFDNRFIKIDDIPGSPTTTSNSIGAQTKKYNKNSSNAAAAGTATGSGHSSTSQSNVSKLCTTSFMERKRYIELKILSTSECFGEEEILRKKGVTYSRIYRVVCQSDSGTVYAIPKKHILRLMQLFPQIMQLVSVQIQNKEESRQIRMELLNKNIKKINNANQCTDNPLSCLSEEHNHQCTTTIQHQMLRKKWDQLVPGGSGSASSPAATASPSSNVVKFARNCEFVSEDIFSEDDNHNYLIPHEKISMNAFLAKNPKLKKSDFSNPNSTCEIKEMSREEYLKMVERNNQTNTTERVREPQVRSTLLLEENLKRKNYKQKSKALSSATNMLTSAQGTPLLDSKYLTQFSEKFNIPLSELSPTYNPLKSPSFAKSQSISSLLSQDEPMMISLTERAEKSRIYKGSPRITAAKISSPQLSATRIISSSQLSNNGSPKLTASTTNPSTPLVKGWSSPGAIATALNTDFRLPSARSRQNSGASELGGKSAFSKSGSISTSCQVDFNKQNSVDSVIGDDLLVTPLHVLPTKIAPAKSLLDKLITPIESTDFLSPFGKTLHQKSSSSITYKIIQNSQASLTERKKSSSSLLASPLPRSTYTTTGIFTKSPQMSTTPIESEQASPITSPRRFLAGFSASDSMNAPGTHRTKGSGQILKILSPIVDQKPNKKQHASTTDVFKQLHTNTKSINSHTSWNMSISDEFKEFLKQKIRKAIRTNEPQPNGLGNDDNFHTYNFVNTMNSKKQTINSLQLTPNSPRNKSSASQNRKLKFSFE